MAFAAARMILKDRRRKPSGEEFQSPRNRCNKNQPRGSDGSLSSIREVTCPKNAGKFANSPQVAGANSPSPTSNNAPGKKITPDSASNKTSVTGKNVNAKANKGANPTHDLIVTIDLSEHGLTEAQVADFKEAFMLIDKDEDGMITVTELGKVMKSLGQRSTDKELRILVREVSNDDLRNTVEFNEFLQLMSKKLRNDDCGEELLEAFRVFDKLGDGWIMSTDLRFIMKQLGERLTDVEVDEMLKEADRDNKGRVNYQEFAELLINADLRDVFRYSRSHKQAHEGGKECKLHVPTHLCTALKTSLQLGAYKTTSQILLYLFQHGQCSRQFMWQILSMLFVRKSCHESPELLETAGVFSKFPYFPSVEVNAVVIFNMIRKGQYEQAYDEISRFTGIVHSDSDDKYGVLAAMLLFYKFIFQLHTTNFEDQEQADHQMAIEILLSKSYLLPLIAEVCIVTLARLNDHTKKARRNDKAKVEKFIYRYLEAESNGSWGVCGQLHTLAILNAHSFRVSENVKFNTLEDIALRDPGNFKVLELCQMHLLLDQRQRNKSLKNESDIGTESEMSDYEDSSDSDNINTCLELLFNFLDTHMSKQTTSIVREGWALMADVLRRICIKGTYGCVKKLTNLWHMDRKDWWTHFRCLKTDTVDEIVRNKALACYLMESDVHPFVRKSLTLKNSCHLRSLIKQFHPSKRRLDEIIKSVLDVQKRSLQKLESTPPTSFPQAETKLDSFLSKYQHIDSQRIAEEFSHHMNRQPLGSKVRKREATAQSSTLDLYGLPISDRLAKRYEFRRSSTPRSWHSSDGSERSFSSSNDSSHNREAKSEHHGERDTVLKSNEALMQNEGLSHSEPGPCEIALEESSESDLFVPSVVDSESDLEVDWSTRLRSWCTNEGTACRDAHTLTFQFIENYEKFKASKFPTASQGSGNLSHWQKFLKDGVWKDMTDDSSPSSLCSESESEAHGTFEFSSQGISFMKPSNLVDLSPVQQFHDNSARSACSSISDYPNNMDRVLRRLQRDFDDSVQFDGSTDEAECVVEASADELLSSAKRSPHHRDAFSPDMFTDYESELEKVTSSPVSENINLHSTADNFMLNTEVHEKNDCTSSSSKRRKHIKILSSAEKKHSITKKCEQSLENTDTGVKTTKKSKPRKRKLSTSGAKEAHNDKTPKRKRLQRSWAVGDSLSAKPKSLSNPKQSTNIIHPTFGIRKKKSARRGGPAQIEKDLTSEKVKTASEDKKNKHLNRKKGVSSKNLHDWSIDLVKKVLLERRKSK